MQTTPEKDLHYNKQEANIVTRENRFETTPTQKVVIDTKGIVRLRMRNYFNTLPWNKYRRAQEARAQISAAIIRSLI